MTTRTTGWVNPANAAFWLCVSAYDRKRYIVDVRPSSPGEEQPATMPRAAAKKALAAALERLLSVKNVKQPFTFEIRRFGKNSQRMREMNADPEFKAKISRLSSARMREMNADPEFKAKQSARMREMHADPEFNPLAALTKEQRDEYDILKTKGGYSRDEALEIVLRPKESITYPGATE